MLIINSVVIPKDVEDAGPKAIEAFLSRSENRAKVREHLARTAEPEAPVAPVEATPVADEPTALAEEE